MPKMLMLATTAAMIEQFNKNNILILKDMGYEVHVAGNFQKGNPIPEERLAQFKVWIVEQGGKWFDIPSTRKPYDFRNNFAAYRMVVQAIKENQYDFIHCHTPIGAVIGRLAGHATHTKVIYTAHGFHFYKGAPFINWLLYYPVERLLAHYTDVLITINKEDFARAQKFKAKKIYYVPGVGVDTKRFSPDLLSQEEKEKLRASLGVMPEDKMLLSVGELNRNKNYEISIRAVAKLKNDNIKYFICGEGQLKSYLKQLIKQLCVEDKVKLLGYRKDISEMLQCSDLFIFPSLREGLPVALMEAIASKTAVICSNIRGNRELVGTASLFELGNVGELADKIRKNITPDNSISIEKNYELLQKYDLSLIKRKLMNIYQNEMEF